MAARQAHNLEVSGSSPLAAIANPKAFILCNFPHIAPILLFPSILVPLVQSWCNEFSRLNRNRTSLPEIRPNPATPRRAGKPDPRPKIQRSSTPFKAFTRTAGTNCPERRPSKRSPVERGRRVAADTVGRSAEPLFWNRRTRPVRRGHPSATSPLSWLLLVAWPTGSDAGHERGERVGQQDDVLGRLDPPVPFARVGQKVVNPEVHCPPSFPIQPHAE